MTTYQALHTIDESGARFCDAEGILIGEYATVEAAQEALNGYLGGYIRRSEDNATLLPDQSWA